MQTFVSGALLNSVLEDICSSVISLEDIASDEAVQLSSLLNVMVQHAPALFVSQDEEQQEGAKTIGKKDLNVRNKMNAQHLIPQNDKMCFLRFDRFRRSNSLAAQACT